MAVVAGVVFFAVRALLALIPGLAAGFAIKKWSAAAAAAAPAPRRRPEGQDRFDCRSSIDQVE
ncbi:hypothetical protein ACVWZZ_003446 [Bradyrhizobium sp. LM6.10]